MQKPTGYDNAKAQGDFVPVELGGHYLQIMQVVEMQSKTGKPMTKVSFDFAPEDKQAGYFAEQYKNDIRPEKKWSNQATAYILVNDEKGETSSKFKTFITCVEHSNTGFTTQWGINNWNAQFKGKKIGGVFGEQLDYYNGKEVRKRVLRWFISNDRVANAEIPNITETSAHKSFVQNGAIAASDGFMSIPDGIDEDLPFN